MKVRISLVAIVCAAATAALGIGSARAATIKSYCIDSATVAVADDTPLGIVQQFQLDTYATLGGAYTLKIGTGADAASFVDELGDFDYVVSPFSIPGGVFHPVVSGACSAPTTPPATDPGTTAAAATAPAAEEGIFLCYSKGQVDPGVWGATQAQDLLTQGYWKPVAVPGVQSATQYGAFSLVCNPGKGALAAPVAAIDSSGTIYTSPDRLSWLDTYDIVT
jgi:hypothetical protein